MQYVYSQYVAVAVQLVGVLYPLEKQGLRHETSKLM